MPQVITIAHSPDADDRFMFWPLKEGLLPCKDFDFKFQELGTGALNQLALSEVDAPHVCAISAAHYLKVGDRYQPMRMGSSVGMNYGPVIITFEEFSHVHPKDCVFLSPGKSTTAHGVALSLGYVGNKVEEVSITPMERVFERMTALRSEGVAVAALLIHEGRLTYKARGFELVADIGQEWFARHGKSLPLGINVIRRDLSESVKHQLAELFLNSFKYALKNKDKFIDKSGQKSSVLWSPLTKDQMAHYLDLYANETTGQVSDADAQSFEFLLQQLAGRQTESLKFDWI